MNLTGLDWGIVAVVLAFIFASVYASRIFMRRVADYLSAGRTEMSDEMQALCYLAGANSIFLGDKLLTTPNPDKNDDFALLNRLGLHDLHPDDARKIHRGEPVLEPVEVAESAGDTWGRACRDQH